MPVLWTAEIIHNEHADKLMPSCTYLFHSILITQLSTNIYKFQNYKIKRLTNPCVYLTWYIGETI